MFSAHLSIWSIVCIHHHVIRVKKINRCQCKMNDSHEWIYNWMYQTTTMKVVKEKITGSVVRITRILCACPPLSQELNIIMLSQCKENPNAISWLTTHIIIWIALDFGTQCTVLKPLIHKRKGLIFRTNWFWYTMWIWRPDNNNKKD